MGKGNLELLFVWYPVKKSFVNDTGVWYPVTKSYGSDTGAVRISGSLVVVVDTHALQDREEDVDNNGVFHSHRAQSKDIGLRRGTPEGGNTLIFLKGEGTSVVAHIPEVSPAACGSRVPES